ncbi:MAG: TonB-dependent receptor, partial [Tannerellaceae bacterium]|nr:TonB-dependent receptor [Tannerellaceae bacterium]
MVENRWTGEGSTNKYPSAAGYINPWNIARFNSFIVENGATFTIQNIQLGYTFFDIIPGAANKTSLRLSLTAERPLSFFSYNGFTTDVQDGFDITTYPLASSYS